MKKFLSGILVGVLFMTSTIAYAETKKTIDAVFGQVKLIVDGKFIDKETLLYNGTTYVPLRAAAEAIGMEVGWDGSTNTASLTSKTAITSTPAPTSTPKPADALPFTIGKIEYTLDASSYSLETWYGNRTKYTITSFSIEWFDKSDNKERYLYTNEYVKAGGVSKSFRGTGPASGRLDDVEILETSVTFLNKDDEKVYLTYNHKTKEYSVSGKW